MPADIVTTTKYNSAQYGLSLIIHGNGGTAPASVSAYKTSNSSSVTVSKSIPSTTPTLAGHTFLGYALTSSSNAVSKQPGDTMSYTFNRIPTTSTTSERTVGNITYVTITWDCRSQAHDYDLWAKWQALTYTVSYNANGGSGAPSGQTKTYGDDEFRLSATVPTRADYNFKNWNTKADGTGTSYAPGATYTGNANLTLYAIWEPAGAKLTSVDNCNIQTGQHKYARWSIVNASHKYKLTFSIDGAADYTVPALPNEYIAAGTDNYEFVLPADWYAALPNVTSKAATCTLKTYSGSTLIGTSSLAFTVSIGPSIKPTVSATIVPKSSNGTVDGWNVAVQGYSRFRITVNYTLPDHTTLKNVTITGPGINGTYTSYTSGGYKDTSVLAEPGTNTYVVTVTDSRGRTADSVTLAGNTVFAYSPPKISSVKIGRADGDGNVANGSGLYMWFKPTFSKSSIMVDGVEKNGWSSAAGSMKAEYTLHGSSVVSGTKTPISSGTTYKPTGTSFSVALGSAYDLTITVKDMLKTVTKTVTLPSASGFWYGKGNDRLGLGNPPPGPGLYCDWDAHFNGDSEVNGDATFNGTVDITPRRCNANLSSEGWYRILQSATYRTGATAEITDIYITRTVNGTNNEAHFVRLKKIYNKVEFGDESSFSNVKIIDKIRCTNDDSNSYIDIHYNSSAANNVYVNVDVLGRLELQQSVVSVPFTSVAANPDGETIIGEYALNDNGTGDITVNGSVTGQGFADLLFGIGTTIASNTNCDSITTEGKYTCPTSGVGSTLTNPPYTSAFGMLVFRVAESTRLVQIAMPNSTSITMKMRYYNGTTWTAWKTLTPS